MRHFSQLLTIVLFSTVVAWSQPVATPRQIPGYLTSAQTSEVVRIVPPAPMAGDPRFQTDMAIFHATRSLEGSARWALAQSDDNLSLPGLLHAFHCALGLTLSPSDAPKLAALLTRANSDAYAAASVIKIRYQHKRPFQVAEGDVCLSPLGKAVLERSPDYPSGHTALSWETGLMLSQIAPDKAVDVLARARAFGQSRVVCGVHNLSAVEAGWMTAAAVFAMQMSSPEFHKDLDAARTEFASLQAAARTKPEACDVESRTLSNNPY